MNCNNKDFLEKVRYYAKKRDIDVYLTGFEYFFRSATTKSMEIRIREFDGEERSYNGTFSAYKGSKHLDWVPSEFNEFTEFIFEI